MTMRRMGSEAGKKPIQVGAGRDGARGRSAVGFTLVELLVVIAIMGLLISLLMPGLSGARARARQLTCGNNLRQIYLGLMMYVRDNRGIMPLAAEAKWPHRPNPRNWYQHVGDYVGVDMPISPTMIPPGTLFNSCSAPRPLLPWNPHYISYAMSIEVPGYAHLVDTGATYTEGSSSKVPRTERKSFGRLPSELMVFTETIGSATFNNVIWVPEILSTSSMNFRHAGQANAVLAGGALRGYTLAQVRHWLDER